jgi:hypothetical protein
VIFSTGRYQRELTKGISITCSAGMNRPRLNFTAAPMPNPDSLKPFNLAPYQLDFDTERPSAQPTPWRYTIAVRNVTYESLTFRLVASPGIDGIAITMPEGAIAAGGEGFIMVAVDRSIAGELFRRSFTIEASDLITTRFTIPIEKKMRWGPAPIAARQ